MSKTNFFAKYFKYINYFINSLLEKNLNKLNFKNLSYLFKNNKVILIFVALFVIFVTYLLLPTFYNKYELVKKLEIDLKDKLDLNFNFSQNIQYILIPKPHFIISETVIFDDQNEISKIDKLKIFVSLSHLFSLNNIQIKDVVFENANFNFNKNNYNFFSQLLSKSYLDGNLIIKNSNIFFRNISNEVLFINKILKMKYYYDSKEFKNIINTDNEIFNIPFSLKAFLDEDNDKIFSQVNINSMKFKIENELIMRDEKKIGKAEFTLNKVKQTAEYEFEKNYFKFHIFDKKSSPSINYNGKINLKPFFASLDVDLNEINLNYIFSSNAIIAQFLKTEIFNHKNIDFKLNINAENIYNNSNFRNINLNSKIREGLIDTDNTKFKWKNFVDFELTESLIFVKEGELLLDGKLKINVNDYNEVYKFLLTPKNYRNKITKIDLNFTYNFDKKIAELKDIKIDNKINQNVNKILNNVILKKHDLQNKIYFRNLLNAAFKSYTG